MDNKLSKKDYLTIGSLLFGLFFGAGNLIFPVNMGQQAGSHIFLANLGFLVTGIGLPFLGVIAIGISKSNGLFEVAQRVNKTYAYIFTILLYLVIGPFFALPRLATTAFEIGISQSLEADQKTIGLFIFSVGFFLLAWLLSRTPSKLFDYIGKFLNPIFLTLLGFLLAIAFIQPMGSIQDTVVQPTYQSLPFLTGFTQGYNTLDALAALAFGIIIVNTIRERGVTQPSTIASDMIKSGSISILLMGIIYTLLSFMGAMSLGQFTLSENGGIALAQIADYYLGTSGSLLLALVITLACLKTAIGLISAFAQTFTELFPRHSYLLFATLVSCLAALFANVGLTKIITFSTPVLMFLYPLAMTLILLTLLSPLFKNHRIVYQTTTGFTLIASLIDGINATPDFIRNTSFSQGIIQFGKICLPLFEVGMGWILPALIGFAFGIFLSFVKKVNDSIE